MKTFTSILSVALSFIFSVMAFANESPELLPRCHQTDFNLCGFVDAEIWRDERRNVFLIQPKYEWAQQFSNGLAAVRIDGKYGYIDVSGKVVIAPRFDQAEEFDQGLAVAGEMEKGALGVIDQSGNYVVEPTFSYAKIFSDEIILGVSPKNSKHGYIGSGQYGINGAGLYSVSEGWLTKQNYNFDRFSDSDSGLIWAQVRKDRFGRRDNLYGLMRIDGSWLIAPKYRYVGELKHNRAVVTDSTGRAGAVNQHGHEVIPFIFDYLTQWSPNFLQAGKGPYPDRKQGLVTLDGQLLADRYFDEIERPERVKGSIQPLQESFAVKDGEDWKTLLKDGTLLSDQRVGKVFLDCDQFAILYDVQGYALIPQNKTLPTVKFDDTMGSPSSQTCSSFMTLIRNNNYAVVFDNGKVFGGFFENSSGFFGTHRWVSVDNKWGLVDAEGDFAVEPIYTSISSETENGKFNGSPVEETDRTYKVILNDNAYRLHFIEGKYKQEPFVELPKDVSKALKCKGSYHRKSRNGLWGVFHTNGEELIPPQYRAITCFNNGVAWVPVDTKQQWCPLDRNNHIRSAPACMTVMYTGWRSHHDPEKFDKDPYENSVLWMKALLDYGEGRRDHEPRFVPWGE